MGPTKRWCKRSVASVERKLLEKNLAGIVTKDQFDNLMTEYRKKREKLAAEVKALNDVYTKSHLRPHQFPAGWE